MKTSKKLLFISLAILLSSVISGDLSAQTVELNGFTGYQFGGKFNFYEGEFKINDAQNYGGKLAVGLSQTTFVEISYIRMDSEGIWQPYGTTGLTPEWVDMSSNYIHVAGLEQINRGKISPYATLGAGIAWFAAKDNPAYSTSTQFSITFGAGLKVYLSEVIGLRFQGSMLMPMIFEGAGFGFGTGGASAGVYSRITPFQGEFSGGIIIRLNK